MSRLAAKQAALEARMKSEGEARAKRNIDKAIHRGDAVATPAGVTLARQGVEPVATALAKWVKEANGGRVGANNTTALHLGHVDPELAAYIAIRCTLTAAVRGYTLKSTAVTIAKTLEEELYADHFEQAHSALYRTIIRNAQARGQRGIVLAGNLVGTARTQGLEMPDRWAYADRVKIGSKLIEFIITELGIVEVQMKTIRNRNVQSVVFTPKVKEWFEAHNHAACLTRPMFLPTLVPPKPWEGVIGGGYYSEGLSNKKLLTRSFPGQMEKLSKADIAPVLKGVNGLQNTAWRINKRVFEVMKQAWEMDAGLSCLPRREDEEVPESPQEVKDDVKGGPIRKAWRVKVRAIHERNTVSRSARFEFARAIKIAEDNLEEEAIYFPHHLDFRGRCYAAATSLNPQGADEVRGLLEFAEGKALGERGLYWLGVHGANLWGNDKVSMDERFEWALENADKAARVAFEPLADLWWTEADKPWCFLAWCFEWAAARNHGEFRDNCEGFVSHLPVALDGSCNGIQHFSAILRDPVGGAAVNLVPAVKPQDIYKAVAERTLERLQEIADEDGHKDQWIAEGWIAFGIDRKVTKRAVMVLPYGGTFMSCRDYVREAIRDKIKEGTSHNFGEQLTTAESVLASVVWAAIGDVVVGPRVAMTWLQQCARVMTKHGYSLAWQTPTGFCVSQSYKQVKDARVKTKFLGSVVVFRSGELSDKLDGGKQVSAVAPNFVHALDASAMMLTIGACLDVGIKDFAMIHDSYGTHAANTEQLAMILREQFVKMYEDHDVLQEFLDSCKAALPEELHGELPPLPYRGDLDLHGILDSAYFFA